MKKIITLAIAFFLIPFASINGIDIFSLNSNGILYVGGSGPNNYTSIQFAIDDAKDGYTIYVYPGYYNESIVINKSIALIGISEDGEKPVVHALGNESALIINADGCTLKNFILKSKEVLVAPDISPSCVIKSNYNIIENNTFMYGWCSLYLHKSSHNIIKNNEFTKGYWYGIRSDDGTNNTISYNIARDNLLTGFFSGGERKSTITLNIATDNCHGMEIGGDSCIVSFNHVYGNRQYGIIVDTSSNISILNNSIHDHNYGGLLLMDCSYCTISGNEIYSNEAGVMIKGTTGVKYEGSIYNVVTRNNIHENGVGIYWQSGCKNNYFTYNNLVDNSVNAYFWAIVEIGNPEFPPHAPSQNNRWDKNYWSNWRLPLPKPIRGTLTVLLPVFYVNLPWFVFDMHPAMEPYGNFTLNNK